MFHWNSTATGIKSENIEIGLVACFGNIFASARGTSELDQLVLESNLELGELAWVVKRAAVWCSADFKKGLLTTSLNLF